ncbi:DUF6049 family protein [Streptomyces sp. PSAA01]|uniref:DUF6049 family protein n=1 Tax=Streptomyces sp. PSAA01 TaxID=2912762 RepID=UPI001F44CBA7|nr:DUF6049 family protein [Streptomyces sp. PSAA01]MCG0289403.1 DUF6049 family protein [Streptomyces sp. PSAA01]
MRRGRTADAGVEVVVVGRGGTYGRAVVATVTTILVAITSVPAMPTGPARAVGPAPGHGTYDVTAARGPSWAYGSTTAQRLSWAYGSSTPQSPSGSYGSTTAQGPSRSPGTTAARSPSRAYGSSTPQGPSRKYPVSVELASLTPAVIRQGGDLTISGRVTNTSGRRLGPAHIGVRIGASGAIDTRGGLSAVARRRPLTRADGPEVAGRTVRLAALPTGAERGFRLTVPVPDLELDDAGAYALTVNVVREGGAGAGTVLGLTRTHLSSYPDATRLEPLRTTVLWPVLDAPRMEALTLRTQDSVLPVFRDDELTAAFGPGGRLRRLVEMGKGQPVTWVLDPDLIVQARAMAAGYRVARTPGDSDPQEATEGEGGEAAADWLAALRAAVRGREVIALPYADPDLASLARGGGAPLAGLLRRASRTGRSVVDRALGVHARTGVGWPAGGELDDGIARYAKELGLDTVLASGAGVASEGELVSEGATDDGAVSLEGGTTALRYDAAIAAQLFASHPAAGAAGEPARLLLRQRLLAETLTAARELPYARRELVMVPPRRMSLAVARVLLTVVAEGRKAGWLEPAGFTAALRKPTAGRLRGFDGYPLARHASELPPARLAAVVRDRRRMRALAKVLSDARATAASVRAALARSVATAWRADPSGAASYQEGVSRYLTASVASVRLVPKSMVVVAGGSATIPVTVDNGLQQDLTGVELRVLSSRPERLNTRDRAMPVRASRAVSRTVRIRVKAYANGPVRLTAQLYTTADGLPWGAPMTFTADVRSVPSGAVIFVLGGTALIVLAAAFRPRRARRARRAPRG